jgi:hypothetical protein
MPILIYWKYSNYIKDTESGFAYHFNSNQERLHDCTDLGDDIFIVSQIRDGDVKDIFLLAHFVVESQEFNPPNYKYGAYRIYADKEKSRYFSPSVPLTPMLLGLSLSKPLPKNPEKHPQALQKIREISQADAQQLKAFADTLPVFS